MIAGGSRSPVNSRRVRPNTTSMLSDAPRATTSPPRSTLITADRAKSPTASFQARLLPRSSCPASSTMQSPSPTARTRSSTTWGSGERSSSRGRTRTPRAGSALSIVRTPTTVVSVATTRTSPGSRTTATGAPGRAVVGNGVVGSTGRGAVTSPPRRSGRWVGNRITSRIDVAPDSSMTRRSTPMPSPPVGARPRSSARRNPSSTSDTSAPMAAADSMRSRCWTGSLSSL